MTTGLISGRFLWLDLLKCVLQIIDEDVSLLGGQNVMAFAGFYDDPLH